MKKPEQQINKVLTHLRAAKSQYEHALRAIAQMPSPYDYPETIFRMGGTMSNLASGISFAEDVKERIDKETK